MEFPNEKLTGPKEIRISVKAVKKIIKDTDLKFWDINGGLSGEGLDEMIDALKALREVD